MVDVQAQTLEKMILGFGVLPQLREALTKRLIILRERGFGFREANSSVDPVDFGVPFLEPGHSEDELRFSEVEHHKTNGL